MLVTITTDASFVYVHRAGAFAFWITSELGRIKLAGPLDGEIFSSTQAEVRCIINAVYYLRKHSKWPDIEAIVINTDCLGFIEIMETGKSRWARKDQLQKEIDIFNQLTRRWRVYFKHVKAHKDTETKRSWVNDWCDKQAKRQIAILLQSIKGNDSNQ